MSRENVDAVRSSLEGWNHGDIEAWLGSPHPDIEFRTSGLYPEPTRSTGGADCADSGPPSASLGSRCRSRSIEYVTLATKSWCWAPSKATHATG